MALTHGDPDRGLVKIDYYGCTSCHVVPGLPGANGLIGPSLDQIASRAYLGGVLQNTPENMIRWISNAPAISPMTAMPRLDIPDADARGITAYLYTLEK